ncbi:hypothetical protein Tco_1535047 [Tanacetum coccineum]
MRVPPAMSPGLSTNVAEVTAMFDSTFCKRFRSFYESSPSSSLPDLPLRKRYRGTTELVKDDEEEEDDEEGDDEEEDEEIEESMDFDSMSEGVEDEGPTAEDEDPAAGDEGLAAGDEGPGMGVESLSLGGDEDVPRGQQRATSVAETAVGEPLGLGYGALRCREIASGEGQMPSVFKVEDGIVYIDVPAYPTLAPPAQTPPSPEWSSGSLPISPAPFIVPLPISSLMISLTVPSLGGLIRDHTIRLEELSLALFERYDRDIGELFTRSRVVRDEIFSQRYRFRNLEHEHERVAVTFGVI